MNRLITTDGDTVIVDVNLLSIPEFRSLYDHYQKEYGETDTIKAFQYLYYMYDPESPYFFLEEEDKEIKIKRDFKGRFNPQRDSFFIAAADKMKTFTSPTARFLESLKISLDKIAMFIRNEEVASGKDGNFGELVRLHKEANNLLKNFNAVEESFRAEMTKTRSKTKRAVDENETGSDDF
jgi:hypothetical protein